VTYWIALTAPIQAPFDSDRSDMNRRVPAFVIAAVSACAVAAVSAAPSAVAAPHHRGHLHHHGSRLLKTSKHELLPVHGGTASSLNWSGYVVTPSGGGITAVKSSFTVPAAGLLPPGFTATWTGIGGYNTSDLIQAGVSENSALTGPLLGGQYNAWYEILPDSETPLTNCSGDPACTVRPGDVVTVTITQTSAGHWDVNVSDPAQGWTFDKSIAYASSLSSAEWILEAPTVAVQTIPANTGVAHFGPISTYTDATGTHTIAAGNPTVVDMGPGIGINEATPSALGSDGQSFNDCTYAQSCPTP
jgi:hypothetical protein